MTGPVFVDTNVLVYARDASEREKQPQAMAWMDHLWHTRTGRLSVQVLHEFYVTVTRKLQPGLPRQRARSDVRHMQAWRPVPLDLQLLEGAWAVQDVYGLSFWDALIVSGAQATNCRFLLTEDLGDGRVYGRIKVLNPFTHAPASLQQQ